MDFIRDANEGDRPATLSLTMGNTGTSGNVGIGTTEPGSKLDIAGTVNIRGAGSGGIIVYRCAGGSSSPIGYLTTNSTSGNCAGPIDTGLRVN